MRAGLAVRAGQSKETKHSDAEAVADICVNGVAPVEDDPAEDTVQRISETCAKAQQKPGGSDQRAGRRRSGSRRRSPGRRSPARTALALLCGLLTGSLAYVLYTSGMKGMETSLADCHALMEEERGQDHDDGRRGVEKGGGGRYFGDFDGCGVAGREEEQAQEAVGDKERDVCGPNVERGAVRGADQRANRDGGGEHAQEDQGVAGEAHGGQYGDEGAVQPPQDRAGDDHGGGGGETV